MLLLLWTACGVCQAPAVTWRLLLRNHNNT
jgi:hypothetical protein